MSTPFTIRPATITDLPTLVRHRSLMFIDIARLKGEEINPDSIVLMEAAYREYLEKRLIDGSTHAWIALDRNIIIASAAITLVPGLPPSHTNLQGILPYVHDVYTQSEYRQKGLARQLVQYIIEYCRQQGYPRVTLHASSQGRAIYASLGFVDSNEMRLLLD